jgi:hypothetical protein
MPELAEELLPLLLTDPEVGVCATAIEIKTGTAKIQAHCFIAPPKLDRAPHCKPSEKYSRRGFVLLVRGNLEHEE